MKVGRRDPSFLSVKRNSELTSLNIESDFESLFHPSLNGKEGLSDQLLKEIRVAWDLEIDSSRNLAVKRKKSDEKKGLNLVPAIEKVDLLSCVGEVVKDQEEREEPSFLGWGNFLNQKKASFQITKVKETISDDNTTEALRCRREELELYGEIL